MQTTHGYPVTLQRPIVYQLVVIVWLATSAFTNHPASSCLTLSRKPYASTDSWICRLGPRGSSKEILTKLQNRILNLFHCINCLSARYYWLQCQTKYQLFQTVHTLSKVAYLVQVALTLDKIDNLQTPRGQCKIRLIVCRQQCIIDMRQVLGFQATTNLSATVLGAQPIFTLLTCFVSNTFAKRISQS